jgi:hypothetical protein
MSASWEDRWTRRTIRRGTATLAALSLCLAFGVAGASAQAPGNDNRGAAQPTGSASTTVAADNFDATTEPGELQNCNDGGPSPFDSTVWFSFDPPAAGTAVFTVAGGTQFTGDGDGGEPGDDGFLDTVIVLYDANGAPQVCDDDTGGGFQSQVSAFYPAINPGPVLLQVGGFDYGPATFFEWGAFTYAVTFSPATRVSANLKYRYQRFPNFIRLTKASVSAESGSTIQIRCKGDCGFKGEKQFTRSPVSLLKLLPGRINFGTAIDVFVTEPNRFGYYARLKIKPKPKKKARCLGAGVLDPTRANISPCPA